MYSDKYLDVHEREQLCYRYFKTYNLSNRDQLRSKWKTNPIEGVTVGFAEEMLADYNRARKQKQKAEHVKQKDLTKQTKIVVINDLHIPYQDDISFNLVCECIIDLQPEYLVLNGDILDFYGCSRFDKQPDKDIILQSEIDLFYRKFSGLRKYIPNTEIHYNLGNHENRIVKIMKAEPGLWNLDVLSPETLLKLDKLNIIPHHNKFTINDFIFYHGDVVRQEGSYSAKAEFYQHKMRTGISAHTHRLGCYHHTYDKEVTFWYENGCLCSLEPDYLKDPTKANWQQGFAIITMVEDIQQVDQILIQNHKFVYNGKLYKE